MKHIKNKETEIKFYIYNRSEITKKIIKIGGKNLGNQFETNIIFENKKHNLKKNILLRLRKNKKTILTLKKTPAIKNKEFKIRQEFEITISNFETMTNILSILGYHKSIVYEKWRETWEIKKCIVCLDDMPYGCFLEIEGRQHNIKILENKLKLHWQNRILPGYIEIFKTIKQKEHFNFKNLKFNNFKKKYNIFKKYKLLFKSL